MSDVSPTEHFEHAEHAEHAAHSENPFLPIVALTIAILAVVAASVGSLETIETQATIDSKNDAVLLQNKATDIWNLYEAKSIKKNMYEIAAAAGSPKAADFKQEALRNGTDEKQYELEAKTLETQRDAKLEASERHEHRHGVLTIAVTLLQISIAVATISIVRRGARWPWYVALALGFAGILGTAFAYL